MRAVKTVINDSPGNESPSSMKRNIWQKRFKLAVIVLGLCASGVPGSASWAQDADGISVATHWQGAAELKRPDMSALNTLRFVTDNDYPPFNYADETGKLVGFNVDLARALCDELSVRCIIEPMAWDKQLPALKKGTIDAVMASRKINILSRRDVLFTDRYYRTPARFAVRQNSPLKGLAPSMLAGKKIAVLKGTAHEAYLRSYYKKSKILPFKGRTQAREALRGGLVDALFGDAISMMFWLNGTASSGCCRFSGGPYIEAKFFGDGVGIALKPGNRKLAKIFNYGLDRLRRRGVYRDLLLRHFPAGNF